MPRRVLTCRRLLQLRTQAVNRSNRLADIVVDARHAEARPGRCISRLRLGLQLQLWVKEIVGQGKQVHDRLLAGQPGVTVEVRRQ